MPTWRAGDTTREIDLVEEVARVVGVEAVPTVLPPHADAIGRWGEDERFRRQVVDVLCGAGLSESVTMSFWDDAMPARLRLPEGHPAAAAVRVVNPMSADQTHLRTLVFPGLLTSLARNLSVRADAVALFEVAQVVLPADAPIPDQPQRIAGVMTGPGIGFGDVRGVVETLYAALHLELAVTRSTEPFLHPGRSAQCAAGFFGELHPLVGEAFGVEVPVVVFELDVSTLAAAQTSVVMHRDVTSFPPLRQDIAVVVGDDVAAGDVVAAAAGRGRGIALAGRGVRRLPRRSDRRGQSQPGAAPGIPGARPHAHRRRGRRTRAREIVTALQSQFGATRRDKVPARYAPSPGLVRRRPGCGRA